ncbi:MAG: hypothetical protein E2O93_04825 [Alphaproteobacteria bacterium]|nr:MAG: hypothetical protein E2O93_04825 [Alphaproteobacteria bacterium]
MAERRKITAATVSAVAAEIAGHPLDDDRASAYADIYESILQAMDQLRKLPLKDIEPAVVFCPQVGRHRD